jgi:hypothetical protein
MVFRWRTQAATVVRGDASERMEKKRSPANVTGAGVWTDAVQCGTGRPREV